MQERTVLDYWLILYKHRVAVYVVIAASMVSSLLIGWTVPPIYEARAALYLPEEIAPVSYITGDSANTLAQQQNIPIMDKDAYKPYIGILKSLQLAQMVNRQYPQKELVKLLRSDVDFEVSDELIVRVYARDPDPVLAANIANAYVDGLNRILAASSQDQVAQEPGYIQSVIRRVRSELKNAEAELQRYEEKNHLASLDAELAGLTSQKNSLQNRQEENTVLMAANLRRRKALIEEIRNEGQDMEASEVATTSPLIENLRLQLADLMTRHAEMSVELGKNNIMLITLEKRRQEVEQQLNEEIKRWLSSRIKPRSSHAETLRQQLIDATIDEQRLEATRSAYEQSLARLDNRLHPYPEIKARWNELNQEVLRLRGLQNQLHNNLTEASIQTEKEARMLVRLDPAEPPKRPAFPIWWLNSMVALLIGTLVGIAYAFFLNYVEETRGVRTTRLVRTILGRS